MPEYTQRRTGGGVTVKVTIASRRVIDLYALGVQFVGLKGGVVVRQEEARFTVEGHGGVIYYISIFSTYGDTVQVQGLDTIPDHANVSVAQL